jgi:putative transposase
LSSLCALLGYSRQALYKYNKNNTADNLKVELIVQEILKIRKLQPMIGVRKLLVVLQPFMESHCIKPGRDALFNLLRRHGLLVRKRKTRVQTTFSRHWLRKYPNLAQGMVVQKPGCLWVSDITYLQTGNNFSYLSLITDAYSKKIMGFHLSETLDSRGCLNALKMAIKDTADTGEIIHHSDRGVQYCSSDYVQLLKSRGIKISMTQTGDPLENAVAERVNGIIKNELLKDRYPNFESAQKGVAVAVSVYNFLRPHLSCAMLTPVQAHFRSGTLKKYWKNYYKKKEVDMIST